MAAIRPARLRTSVPRSLAAGFWPGPGPAAPQVQGYQAQAENGAAIKSMPDPEPSSSASAHRPAAAHANATPWDALYARGHQFQLEGNLVAAAEPIVRQSSSTRNMQPLSTIWATFSNCRARRTPPSSIINGRSHTNRDMPLRITISEPCCKRKGMREAPSRNTKPPRQSSPKTRISTMIGRDRSKPSVMPRAQPRDTGKRSHLIPTIAPASMRDGAWPPCRRRGMAGSTSSSPGLRDGPRIKWAIGGKHT